MSFSSEDFTKEELERLSQDLQPTDSLREALHSIALRSLAYETILGDIIVHLVKDDQHLADTILSLGENPSP